MENKYTNELFSNATKLDDLLDDRGVFLGYVSSIATDQDDIAITGLLRKISSVLDSNMGKSEIIIQASALKDSLIKYLGYIQITDICNKGFIEEDTRTLEQLLCELNELIGLSNVKTCINDLISFQKIQKQREELGLSTVKRTLHISFTGNPGTGKTTVARIVGHIYKQIGLLSKGHFVEVSRTDLIAGYQGQTALKVKKVIEKAKGGVLFIDEAYSITENEQSDSYGKECLTELTKALEDFREDIVVIVAGYTKPMEKFFNSNPGLKSRFNTFIEFDDYSSVELEQILLKLCSNNDYVLEDKVINKIREHLDGQLNEETVDFANARLIRNIYDQLIINQAKRLVMCDSYDTESLSLITVEDFVD